MTTEYDLNDFPKLPNDVNKALDSFQEAAILNGEGSCRYSTMSEKRRLLERYIVDALHVFGRGAYAAGLAAQVKP